MAGSTSRLFACALLGLVLAVAVPAFADPESIQVDAQANQVAVECDCSTALAPLQTQIEELNSALNVARTKSDAASAFNAELEVSIKEKDAAAASLSSEVQTLRSSVAQLQDSLSTATDDLAAARVQLEDVTVRAADASKSDAVKSEELGALQRRAELAESRLAAAQSETAYLTDKVKSAEKALAKAIKDTKAARDPSVLDIIGFFLESIWSVVENGLNALAPAWNLGMNKVTSNLSVLSRAVVEAYGQGSAAFHANVWTKVEPSIRPALNAASPFVEKAKGTLVEAATTGRSLIRENVAKFARHSEFVSNNDLVTDAVCTTADAFAVILLCFVALSVLSTTCGCFCGMCCSKKRRPSKMGEKVLKKAKGDAASSKSTQRASKSRKPRSTDASDDEEPNYAAFVEKPKRR